jgi:hypothetical protein
LVWFLFEDHHAVLIILLLCRHFAAARRLAHLARSPLVLSGSRSTRARSELVFDAVKKATALLQN